MPDAGVPSAGVTRTGEVANTLAPVPVSSVSAVASCAELNEPSAAVLPVEVTWPVKLALVVTLPAVRLAAVPVAFVSTTDAGVPKVGVISVGELANTSAPVPVSSVIAVAKLALDGVPKNVDTPDARPTRPVDRWKYPEAVL